MTKYQKGQQAAGPIMVLILLIALFIILYLLLIPPEDRSILLNRTADTGNQDNINNGNTGKYRNGKKAAWEILKDLQAKIPMNRLLEGDVGSGKTIVALLAAYNVVLNNWQSVFLTPTEILASQHFKTIYKLLGHHIKIGLLTRSQRVINDQIFTIYSKV